jgi:thioredoxin reductase
LTEWFITTAAVVLATGEQKAHVDLRAITFLKDSSFYFADCLSYYL